MKRLKGNNEKESKIKSKKIKGKKRKQRNWRKNRLIRISSICFEAVQTAIRRRVTAFNFENQRQRVRRQKQLAENKFLKRDVFGSIAQKLITVGGGDSDNLTCAGSRTSSNAQKLNAIALSLLECSQNITKFCRTEFPSFNQTLIDECKQLSNQLKNLTSGTNSCSEKENEVKQCDCWTRNIDLLEKIKKCQINERQEITIATENCRTAFMLCRKHEDASIQSIYECQPLPCCLCPCPTCTTETRTEICNNEIRDTNNQITLSINQMNLATAASEID